VLRVNPSGDRLATAVVDESATIAVAALAIASEKGADSAALSGTHDRAATLAASPAATPAFCLIRVEICLEEDELAALVAPFGSDHYGGSSGVIHLIWVRF